MPNQLRKAERQVNVNDVVIYTDEHRVDHGPALVTAVHGESYVATPFGGGEEYDAHPCINLLFVSDDESRYDDYGRQIERYTSIVHAHDQTGGGICWRFPDEDKPTGQPVRR